MYLFLFGYGKSRKVKMYISRVLIKGFRSIKQCDIIFKPGKNILIGKNSSGKSNIITAIDILFGERHPSRFETNEGEFYFDTSTGERAEEISIFRSFRRPGVR